VLVDVDELLSYCSRAVSHHPLDQAFTRALRGTLLARGQGLQAMKQDYLALVRWWSPCFARMGTEVRGIVTLPLTVSLTPSAVAEQALGYVQKLHEDVEGLHVDVEGLQVVLCIDKQAGQKLLSPDRQGQYLFRYSYSQPEHLAMDCYLR
jgi:hypothetical protein